MDRRNTPGAIGTYFLPQFYVSSYDMGHRFGQKNRSGSAGSAKPERSIVAGRWLSDSGNGQKLAEIILFGRFELFCRESDGLACFEVGFGLVRLVVEHISPGQVEVNG